MCVCESRWINCHTVSVGVTRLWSIWDSRYCKLACYTLTNHIAVLIVTWLCTEWCIMLFWQQWIRTVKMTSVLQCVVLCMWQLTDKQYTWIALNARARLRRWEEIEQLFQTKVSKSIVFILAVTFCFGVDCVDWWCRQSLCKSCVTKCATSHGQTEV